VEIGILYRIGIPTVEERRKYNAQSFKGIIDILKGRGVLSSKSAIAAIKRIHVRRNLFTHDAILQQTITKVEEDWFRKNLKIGDNARF